MNPNKICLSFWVCLRALRDFLEACFTFPSNKFEFQTSLLTFQAEFSLFFLINFQFACANLRIVAY